MAVYLPKAREQSTSHLPESRDSKNPSAIRETSSSAVETLINTSRKAHLAHRGEFMLMRKKLHVGLCRKELPTVFPYKIKRLLDVSRAPLKPTICKKDNLKYKHSFKKIKARSKKGLINHGCFLLWFCKFFFPKKHDSQSIFVTDFVVPGGGVGWGWGKGTQCLSSSRFSWANKIISLLFYARPSQAVPP